MFCVVVVFNITLYKSIFLLFYGYIILYPFYLKFAFKNCNNVDVFVLVLVYILLMPYIIQISTQQILDIHNVNMLLVNCI